VVKFLIHLLIAQMEPLKDVLFVQHLQYLLFRDLPYSITPFERTLLQRERETLIGEEVQKDPLFGYLMNVLDLLQ